MKNPHACLAIIAATIPLVALPALTAAQDRLPKMPGYTQNQTAAAARAAAPVVSGAVSGNWSDDSKSFTYLWNGKSFRFDAATRAVVAEAAPAAGADAAPPAGGRGGRGAGGRAGGGGGGGGRGGRGGAGGGAAPTCTAGLAAIGGAGRVERGGQATTACAPKGGALAFYRDRNLYVVDSLGKNEVALTTDGSEKDRIKYGTASWVYGEELGQTSAIWWNDAGTKLGYYRFDESKVPDFYIALGQTGLQTSVNVEAYPKPGVPNPVVDLFVYDVATRRSIKLDVRDGKPFENNTVGYYVYNVRWAKNGELLVNRTNRRQNILEVAACSPETGKCRVVIHEEWLASWLENRPTMTYLADGNRFLWETVRNGYSNFDLYDLSGKRIAAVTQGQYEAASIVRVDEAANVLYYTARDGDNFMKLQLHRVNLDGTGDVRLTDPTLTHATTLSPDGQFFLNVAQAHDKAPVSRIVDATGKIVVQLAKSDLTKFTASGQRPVEMFSYMAADGKTKLYGTIAFPLNFNPARKYPTLVPVYGGPASGSNTPTESFSTGGGNTDYGFLVVNLHTRASPGMGKRVLDALYLKLGVTEIDDMAAGIKALATRPYFDKTRVGMYGTSYGGYSSLMAILRYPDVFQAASSSSPPTDWRNYDTIYTERYMWIPDAGENKEGYDAGSAMTYAGNLKGALMLYYGSADNNVHNTNMMQIVRALQTVCPTVAPTPAAAPAAAGRAAVAGNAAAAGRAGGGGGRGGRGGGGPPCGKHFELQVGPDAGHSGLNASRMMEFFIENLVMKAPTPAPTPAR